MLDNFEDAVEGLTQALAALNISLTPAYARLLTVLVAFLFISGAVIVAVTILKQIVHLARVLIPLRSSAERQRLERRRLFAQFLEHEIIRINREKLWSDYR